MNLNHFDCLKVASAIVVISLSGVVGCSHKKDVNSELGKASSAFATSNTPPVSKTADVHATQIPAQQVNQAMAAYKAGNYSEAVGQLNQLLVNGSRGNEHMTAQQFLALQDARRAVLQDLSTRAAQGDARAKQALTEYQQLQRSR